MHHGGDEQDLAHLVSFHELQTRARIETAHEYDGLACQQTLGERAERSRMIERSRDQPARSEPAVEEQLGAVALAVPQELQRGSLAELASLQRVAEGGALVISKLDPNLVGRSGAGRR